MGKIYVKYVGNDFPLEKGKIYEVQEICAIPGKQSYTLRNIDGKFPSSCFEKVTGNHENKVPTPIETEEYEDTCKKTYLAVSHNVPQLGERLSLVRVEKDGEHYCRANTSPVAKIHVLEADLYWVQTQNSNYIIQVT